VDVRRTVGLLAVAGILAAVAWIAGLATGWYVRADRERVPSDVSAPANFGLFDETWRIVEEEYYGDIPPAGQVDDSAIEGLVAALDDPYTAYLDADESTTIEAAVENFLPEFVPGVGAWVVPVAEGGLVMAVESGSPAEEAGLAPHDTLLGAGDEPLAGLAHDTLADLLRGPPETDVSLAVLRGRGAPFSTTVQRTDVTTPTVSVEQPEPSVAHLRVPYFAREVVQALDQRLQAVQDAPLDGLIVDLRDNPGGDLDSVRAVAGRFMKGDIWIEQRHGASDEVRRAETAGAPNFDAPRRLIVLVNAGTAGGAEMLAGALRDQAGAELVGETTFGKGTVQRIEPLSTDRLLRLTVGQWRTPDGSSVEGVGLAPDVTAQRTAEDRAAGRDPQLEAALRAVRQATASSGG
jgi:carboxyl-terminal processing protease